MEGQFEEKLLSSLRTEMKTGRYAPADIALVERAFVFAAEAHSGQKRMSGEPYIIHPVSTAYRLAHMRLDAETISGALLHDVCEDTHVSPKDIRKVLGERIAFLVEGITKLDQVRYRETERDAENLRKMFLAVAKDIRIVLIKLADRFHNMETLHYVAPEKRKRIAMETLEIYAPLAYRLGIGELKGQLEDLAFPYAYPQEHHWLMRHIKDTLEERRAYAARLIPKIQRELECEKLYPKNIHARAKHHYSLYRKLVMRNEDIRNIHDLIALRIIVGTVEECYRALGIIHKFWPPLPGRIKDYIATPKPNGYQSLHTTVFGPEKKITEIQIRTPSMHEEAENGIAAHWAYTELKNNPATAAVKGLPHAKNLAWVSQLREWQKEFQNPEDFLESLKIDFFKDRIFVFTPKGEVLDLPEGSTPIDFAYQIHSQVGDTAVGARVNGRMVTLSHELKNVDVVEILTQKNKKPSQGWLKFVKTASAKKKILSVLRQKK